MNLTDSDYEQARNQLPQKADQYAQTNKENEAQAAGAFEQVFGELMRVLVLALNRLDYTVLDSEWLPQFVKVIEAQASCNDQDGVNEQQIKLVILKRIFCVCLMPASTQNFAKALQSLGLALNRSLEEQIAECGSETEKLAPFFICLACSTAPFGEGYEILCDD